MKEKEVQTTTSQGRVKEPYHEPLLLKHAPLLDITGAQAVSLKQNIAITKEVSSISLANEG